MNSAKYQSDIIHNIDMTCECVVFHIYICHNSKGTRPFLKFKGMPLLKWPGNRPDMSPIENVWIIIKKEIGNQMQCKKKIRGSENVKRGIE